MYVSMYVCMYLCMYICVFMYVCVLTSLPIKYLKAKLVKIQFILLIQYADHKFGIMVATSIYSSLKTMPNV